MTVNFPSTLAITYDEPELKLNMIYGAIGYTKFIFNILIFEYKVQAMCHIRK